MLHDIRFPWVLALAACACGGELHELSASTEAEVERSGTNPTAASEPEPMEPSAGPDGRPSPSLDASSHTFRFSDFDAPVRGRTSIEILAWAENDGTNGFRVLLRSDYLVTPPDEGSGGHQCWMNASEARAFGMRERVTTCSGHATALRYPTPFEEDVPGRIMEVEGIALTDLDHGHVSLTFDLRRMEWDEAAPERATLTIDGPVVVSCAVTNGSSQAESTRGDEPLRDTMWDRDACRAAVEALGLASHVQGARTAFP